MGVFLKISSFTYSAEKDTCRHSSHFLAAFTVEPTPTRRHPHIYLSAPPTPSPASAPHLSGLGAAAAITAGLIGIAAPCYLKKGMEASLSGFPQ